MPQFSLWQKAKKARTLLSLAIEITPRCNNNCVHCYINQPERDSLSVHNELSLEKWTDIIDSACEMGALWLLISGGEPLLRDDFSDIYIYAKKKGLLVSVFTNASLISKEHVSLFKTFPPRSLEITVYGVSNLVHNRVTQAGLFNKTMAGIRLLKKESIPITLKAIALKSNYCEINQIYDYCKSNSDRPVRIDSLLHLRYDNDPEKNRKILSQRLSPDRIIEIDKIDHMKCDAIRRKCTIVANTHQNANDQIKMLRCSAGINSCCISFDGIFKLCTSLNNNRYTYDLKNGTLQEAWEVFTPTIRNISLSNLKDIKKCFSCDIEQLCAHCAAIDDLEGVSDHDHLPYYCDVAKMRLVQFKKIGVQT